MRSALRLLLGAAVYGFACGVACSFEQGARNLLKFPLLLVVTATVCALAWFLFARFFAAEVGFRAVQALALGAYHDLAVLLASLAPATLFLALTMEDPVSFDDLGGYPVFQGVNVGFIALGGCVAVVRQAKALPLRFGVSRRRGAGLTLIWLALSLFVGAQCSWYFRPYFGLAFETDLPFMMGTAPDSRGARSFYEALWNLVSPP